MVEVAPFLLCKILLQKNMKLAWRLVDSRLSSTIPRARVEYQILRMRKLRTELDARDGCTRERRRDCGKIGIDGVCSHWTFVDANLRATPTQALQYCTVL